MLGVPGWRFRSESSPFRSARPSHSRFRKQPSATPPAIMFEGINRSCFGTFGQAIGDILRGRAFGKVARTVPLFFGTIGDSPSFLPLGPDLIAFGPAFDTDYLSWDPKRAAGDVKGGLCEAGAWDLQEAAEPEDWADLIDELFPAANILWERQAQAALRRLAALTDPERPGQPDASFLFGWVIPRLLASGVQLDSFAERFQRRVSPRSGDRRSACETPTSGPRRGGGQMIGTPKRLSRGDCHARLTAWASCADAAGGEPGQTERVVADYLRHALCHLGLEVGGGRIGAVHILRLLSAVRRQLQSWIPDAEQPPWVVPSEPESHYPGDSDEVGQSSGIKDVTARALSHLTLLGDCATAVMATTCRRRPALSPCRRGAPRDRGRADAIHFGTPSRPRRLGRACSRRSRRSPRQRQQRRPSSIA